MTGHQRHHDQGHARAHRRGGARDRRDRQGAARGRHRRRAARGRSHAPARVRPADRVAGLGRASSGSADVNRAGPDAAGPAQPDRGRRLPDRRAGALLPAAEERHATRARWPTRSCARREGMPAQARFGERVPVPVTTFAPIATGGVSAAADHVVQLREHRRQHRHHAAHAPRRRRVAGAEGRGEQHLGHRASAACRPSAIASITTTIRLQGRRDEHARRPDPRRRAHGARRACPG